MLFGGKRPVPVRVTADVQVKTGQGKIAGMLVVGGSAVTTIALYDNTSATGDPIFEGSAPINTISPLVSLSDFQGVDFDIGLWADITTTGGVVYVWII